MTTIAGPKCYERKCIHWTGTKVAPGQERSDFPRMIHTCAAFPFPRSIPQENAYGTNDHTTPYPGDNGIRYERK